MNLDTVRLAISSNNGQRDLARIRAVLKEVKELISKGNKVLVHLDSTLGDDHFSLAKTYSKDLRDIEEQIELCNGLLFVTLLRSAKISTSTEVLDKKRATAYLKRRKYAAACVF